ncbi:MAG: iron-sulfur cluster repair di-iron protein, ric [Tissierellia bacterium]|nr:iron-sulfur cluster repair di-iron protein, ric [Tissierellia bacterium]
MKNLVQFQEAVEKELATLKLYVPIVARVHGGAHPEFLLVQEQFQSILKKLEAEETDFQGEFNELQGITSNYTVPEDTCESYEAVYRMLSNLNEAYNADITSADSK